MADGDLVDAQHRRDLVVVQSFGLEQQGLPVALGDRVDPEIVKRIVTRGEGNAFYIEELIRAVAEGSGATVIDGKPIEWTVNDVFVVPPWKRYQHTIGSADAVLFSISDRPMQENLGIWREGN